MKELAKRIKRMQAMAKLRSGYCLAGIEEVNEEFRNMSREIGEGFLEMCNSDCAGVRGVGLKARTLYLVQRDRIVAGRNPLKKVAKSQEEKS